MRKINIEAERAYENLKVSAGDVRANQSKYYWATAPYIDEFNSKVMQRIGDKNILEIGCSSGYQSKEYAKGCSQFHGVDVSNEAIRLANELGLDNAVFDVCDAHTLPFDDSTFDCVIVNSLLHHLDLDRAIEEIYRVLKPGGTLCAREPLGTNPIFNIYRSFTPSSRTVDERPFTFKDLKLIKERLQEIEIVYFGFTSILSAFLRYHIIRRTFSSIDSLLALTPMKYLYWQFYGFYQKK